MKIVVCDDDALVYEQMKNIIASYSIVKNENLELTFYQTVEELLHAKHKYDTRVLQTMSLFILFSICETYCTLSPDCSRFMHRPTAIRGTTVRVF